MAKAQKAAADAAQLMEEEMSRLKRDLEFARKEKKGLVQRCLTTDHELASSLVGPAVPLKKKTLQTSVLTCAFCFAMVLYQRYIGGSYPLPCFRHLFSADALAALEGLHCSWLASCNFTQACAVHGQMAQERLQQQLSSAKAALKASESSKVQMEVQHQAQMSNLSQQLQTAQECAADLAEQHQQDLANQLASATAATTADHQQEVASLQAEYTNCLGSNSSAVAQLQQEVAITAAQAEDDMAAVAQHLSGLLQEGRNSQAELGQQLQQLTSEVATVRQNMSGMAGGGGEGGAGVQQELTSLVKIQQQLAGEGCLGLGGLMQQHEHVKAEVRCHSACNGVTTSSQHAVWDVFLSSLFRQTACAQFTYTVTCFSSLRYMQWLPAVP